MPNFDGTGPRGEGPKTGLGQGDCQDQATDKKDSAPQRGAGRWNCRTCPGCPKIGRGRGQGGGRGFANRQKRDDA